MIWIILALFVAAIVFSPSFWVKYILQKYSEPADRYQSKGTGAELARTLLDEYGLHHVVVEETEQGDHYSSQENAVRLSTDNFNGCSLTAVTVAAHEVGHAIQDARGEILFNTRHVLVRAAGMAEYVASAMLVMAPVLLVLTRAPHPSALVLIVGVGSMALGTIAHLVTLPVEFDASFGKALPMLEKGNYLIESDMPHARRILKAAAMTYVAGSLASLLNLWRWAAILRR